MPPEVLDKVESGVKDANDVLDILNKDDNEIQITDTDEEEIIDDEEVEPEEEKIGKLRKEGDEAEDEKVDLKDEDELEYQEVPRRKEILKEFPELFKKFPTIEKAIYREQAYAEAFPTVADAKDAIKIVEQYRSIESDLLSGNLDNILKQVHSVDKNAFSKIADGYLETLKGIDINAYTNTVGGLVRNALYTVLTEGKKLGDEQGEQLMIAAKLINKFYFQDTNVQPAVSGKAEEKVNPRETELTKREQEFNNRALGVAVNEVTEKVTGSIKSYIEKVLDPKGVMTPYVKKNASKDALDQTISELRKEPRFSAMLDKLWQESGKENFSEGSKSKIRKQLLRRAESILPDVMRRVKADALKGQATRTREASESRDEKPIERGRPASTNNTSTGNKNAPKPGESTLDFLNRD